MASTTPLRRARTLLLAGMAASTLVLSPTTAFADDIESFGGDIVVTLPQEQSRGISRMSLLAAQTSQIGSWVEVKRSESTYIHLHTPNVLLLHLSPGEPRRVGQRHGQDNHVQQGVQQWNLLDHHQDAL